MNLCEFGLPGLLFGAVEQTAVEDQLSLPVRKVVQCRELGFLRLIFDLYVTSAFDLRFDVLDYQNVVPVYAVVILFVLER